MVDIFDEVEEDLRAERTEKLLKKYAWVIVVLMVGVVAGVAGWQYWNRLQAQRDAAAATRFISTQSEFGQAAASKPDQLATLEQLAASAPEGYRTLARLRAASLKADAGDSRGAIALWDAVAADSAADDLLRGFANLMATGHQLDQGDPAQLQARIKPLTDSVNPWSDMAREQMALLDLRQGKEDDARKALQALSIDIGAPAGLRARASALLTGLGAPATK